MNDVESLLSELERFHLLDSAARGACLARCSALAEANDRQRRAALDSVARWLAPGAGGSPGQPAVSPVDDRVLEQFLAVLARTAFSAELIAPAIALYARLPPFSRGKRYLLSALAASSVPAAQGAFAELLASDPPRESADVDLACVPVFRHEQPATDRLFPRLLDAIQHSSAAAAVLDLANHLTRRRLVPKHPAASRAEPLTQLLGAVVERLRRLEERPAEFGPSAAEVRKIVAEGVPLVVGLCDALGLIGDERAVGKLNQALELSHRRLRIEAACALARLHQDRGRDALVELAAQPVARTRALAYLEELGFLDRVPDEQRSPAARAEGDFAEWLAAPMQFGLAPHALILVDECRQYWPGFDQPVDCYLFDFEYHFPQGELSGVGIAGPLTHCFAADLSDFAPADIYAAYAGWAAEHTSIVESTAADLPPEGLARFESVAASLQSQGYSHPRLVKFGLFFEEEHWVAVARRGGAEGVVVVDAQHAHWFPKSSASRPPGPAEVYNMVKGRKLLGAFNG